MKTVNTSVASLPSNAKDFFQGSSDVDQLLRLQIDGRSKTTRITSTSTQIVQDGMNTYFVQYNQNIELLRSVIFWQKRTIDYQALHTAFLMDCLSEDDFEQEAEKFTIYQEDVPPEKIACDVERLYSLIGIDFDTSDYAGFFQCNQQNVMDGLRRLSNPRFIAMLPENK